MPLTLACLAAVLSVAAAVLAVLAWRRSGPTRPPEDLDSVPEDLLGLRQEVAALRAESGATLRHVAVVRYDAFPDTGGHLSWSAALLDDHGDAVVLTAIHGRTEARSYAKNVSAWSGQQLSPEETQAIARARP
jgi:hypothetical protein